jgi:hypothetical protein
MEFLSLFLRISGGGNSFQGAQRHTLNADRVGKIASAPIAR